MRIYIFALLLALTACDMQGYGEPAKYVKEDDVLVDCVSKLDKSEILYYKSQATAHKSEYMPVTVWYIKDVKGKLHSLNNYEIENYVCTTVENDK